MARDDLCSIKPRPTLSQIARWQDEVRSGDEAAVDTKEWRPVASFAVVFARRWADGAWERRTGAERTEVEPERKPEVWPGWECNPVCGWMMDQLGQADRAEPGQGDRSSCASTAPQSPTRPEVPMW